MLYDDAQELEVRYVISLEYHDIDVYSGGDEIPEGELWIKRNAIRLKRKPTPTGDKATSLPFFFFSENMSEKEDFYLALLRNQEGRSGDRPPEVQHFEVKHIIALVQKLHSSEEHLQTRWLNAMIGRMFLAMYKTPIMEEFVRKKLTKKISRVKKPNFITRIALQKIYLGDGGPFITNPRLKDLTVDGDCAVEGDVNYSGNFRIEIAATARLDLGSRFKAREVDLILAVTISTLQGHAILRFKPPPSNRLWFTFDKMPRMELKIEPIVSSRQITLTLVLKAIESRIREVIAESIVFPFWDDAPFLDTTADRFRGGIWKKESVVAKPIEITTEESEEEGETGADDTKVPELFNPHDERAMSMPVLVASPPPKEGLKLRLGKKAMTGLSDTQDAGSSTATDKSSRPEMPRPLRSPSSGAIADPLITANHADADTSSKRPDNAQRQDMASTLLKDLSARSLPTPLNDSSSGSFPSEPATATPSRASTFETNAKDADDGFYAGHEQNIAGLAASEDDEAHTLPGTPSSTATPVNGAAGSRGDNAPTRKTLAAAAKNLTAADRKQALASINAAATQAQKWGWGVLHRNRQREAQSKAENKRELLSAPIGEGRPLPPPGIPLPPPGKTSPMAMAFSMPKRKPVPPPRPSPTTEAAETEKASPKKPPPLPERRRLSTIQKTDEQTDDVLIVEAPVESAPTSPRLDEHDDGFFSHDEMPLEVPDDAGPSTDVGPAADFEPSTEIAPSTKSVRPTEVAPSAESASSTESAPSANAAPSREAASSIDVSTVTEATPTTDVNPTKRAPPPLPARNLYEPDESAAALTSLAETGDHESTPESSVQDQTWLAIHDHS